MVWRWRLAAHNLGLYYKGVVVSTLDTSEIWRFGGIKLLAVEECQEVKLTGSLSVLTNLHWRGKAERALEFPLPGLLKSMNKYLTPHA
jgi:hypothetical protein